MPGNAHKTSPIDWMIYESLMDRMTNQIKELDGFKRVKYARYQSIIAIGAHLGPSFNELVRFRWKDILGAERYQFKIEINRSPKLVEHELFKITIRNYQIVQPYDIGDFIAGISPATGKPIGAVTFNNILHKIFTEFGVAIPNPCAQTLRKTYARHQWEHHQKSAEIAAHLSSELGYEADSIKNYIKIKTDGNG